MTESMRNKNVLGDKNHKRKVGNVEKVGKVGKVEKI